MVHGLMGASGDERVVVVLTQCAASGDQRGGSGDPVGGRGAAPKAPAVPRRPKA